MVGHYTPSLISPGRTMLDFVRLLMKRYQSILQHTRPSAPINALSKANLSSLHLSEAFLEKAQFLELHPKLPIQIVVVGPTQVGKSSLVNLLLGHDYAKVSPLAGFTTYPQGFAYGMEEADLSKVEQFFPGYRRIIRDHESDHQEKRFALTPVSASRHQDFGSCVIWDTPDFDSIHAADYHNSLLRTIAFADVIVLAVSKDKYADQSVWQLLDLIEPLNQPTLVFLNKISSEQSPLVIRSIAEKWRASRKASPPAIISAPFLKQGLASYQSTAEFNQLPTQLKKAIGEVRRAQIHRQCDVILEYFWSNWTDAVREEHNLRADWNSLVEVAGNGAIEIYERYYLNHPQHFDTLKRALAELLTLLEIPGIAPLLTRTRSLLTWPVRAVFGLGNYDSKTSDSRARTSQESKVLERMYEHYRIQLSNIVLSKRAEGVEQDYWWSEISSLLNSEDGAFYETYHQAVRIYQSDFQHEIEEAAHHLYNKLEQQPATLNSLRATRVTTDAAAVAIALKTGGIGVQDFMITPAVLSLTSFLTESALGHYMRRVEAELKQKQLSAVAKQVFDGAINQRMKNLPDRMTPNNKFNIPEASLREADAQLHAI